MDPLLQQGIHLFNHSEFFECHEVLEAAWTPEINPRRLFLQSLIHFAVGFYHHQQNNQIGALLQLRKGVAKLTPYLPARESIDTARLLKEIQIALALIESNQPLPSYPQIHTLPAARV